MPTKSYYSYLCLYAYLNFVYAQLEFNHIEIKNKEILKLRFSYDIEAFQLRK